MADFDGVIDPTPAWPDVPQLGVEAVALGGEGGPMNAQAVALTARTKSLKKDQESLGIVINVASDGFTDPFPIFKQVIESAPAGAKIFIPPGYYQTQYRNPADADNWINISKSGVTIEASPGSVVLENFLIYAAGSAGPLRPVGAAGFTEGDTTINSATAHGLVPGDYVQLVSARNAYTIDGGEWQLGSQNPTNLDLPLCRYTEIHRVALAPTPTTAILMGRVIYPGYDGSTDGYTSPIAGVASAEIRKLTPVIGLTFRGIKFINNNGNFRELLIRRAVDVVFDQCQFEAAENSGVHVRTTCVLGLTFTGCSSYRKPEGASGSGWNSFILAGGTQDTLVTGCDFRGEHQTVDFTPLYADGNIGDDSADLKCNYVTTQMMQVTSSAFRDCSDGFTTHPGTYGLTVSGCDFRTQTGVRIRSKNSMVFGNRFKNTVGGIAFSAFYDGANVFGNDFEEMPEADANTWNGIQFVPLSSEIMNSNNVQNVVVRGNSFRRVRTGGLFGAGVFFRHNGNGVPPSSEFALFTNTIKTNLSRYQIAGNSFHGCGVYGGKWISGIETTGNTFAGGAAPGFYIFHEDHSARHTVHGNTYYDMANATGGARLGVATTPTFPYATTHTVGDYYSRLGVASSANNSIANAGSMTQRSDGYKLQDTITMESGSAVKVTRASGSALMKLDAQTVDGTSNALIRVFQDTVTTGLKQLVVHGNVVLSPPAIATPVNNGEAIFQLTSNTQLTIKVKGSDGTVRSVNLTLA